MRPNQAPETAPSTRWFLTISIYRAIRTVEEFSSHGALHCVEHLSLPLSAACLHCTSHSPSHCTSHCLCVCLLAQNVPAHVVCKNDSGILIRHFKFNSVGLCLAIAHLIMCWGRRRRERQLLRVLCLTHLCAHVSFGCCEGGLFFGIFALYGAWHLTATVSFLSFFIVSGDSRCSLNQRCPCHCFSFSPPIWFLSAARAACSLIALGVYNGFYRAAPSWLIYSLTAGRMKI